mgnify:CR=1 FL=1
MHSTPAPPPRAILIRRTRRIMVFGLLLSTLGNNTVEYGFNALTAAGVVSVGAFLTLSVLRRLSAFAFPVIAKLMGKHSPDKVLIACDSTETVLSVLAFTITLLAPHQAIWAVYAYTLIDLLILAFTDIAEEFYGAHFAQINEDTAMAFNASLSTIQAIVNFVVAGLAGSLLAGVSIPTLLAVNTALSLTAALFRARARHTYPVPPPTTINASQFAATGHKEPLRQFLHDLFTSGPASPLVSLAIAFAGTMSGELFILWAANHGPAVPLPGTDNTAYAGMGLVLTVFGLGAAFGPQAGETAPILRTAALFSAALTGALATGILTDTILPPLIPVFVFLNAAASRARAVVLETHRQAYFRGAQFARIMSWSFTFSAAGTLLGLLVGYLLGQAYNPVPCLLIGTALWLAIAPIVSSRRGGLRNSV